MLKQGGLELGASVGGDDGRNAEAGDPAGYKSLCDCISCDIGNGYGFGPTGEPVNNRQQIGVTLTEWQRTDKVKVDVVKSGIWGREWKERCSGVPLHLSPLALLTSPCPGADISVDVRPHKPGCDEFLRHTNAGV